LRGLRAAPVLELLERVGLADQASKPAGALSGGMRQRLALAIALLGDPPILMLDEPTANLDAGARLDFMHLLAAQREAGRGLLLTSHRVDEVERLADEVIVLEGGREMFRCPAPNLSDSLEESDPEIWPGALEAICRLE
jgi:ABC-type multidrug transport system ATPase subunit